MLEGRGNLMHYRAAKQKLRCSHRHRTPHAAEYCRELAAEDPQPNAVVECIGGPGGELEYERLHSLGRAGNVIGFPPD